jgi:hypothetical protein
MQLLLMHSNGERGHTVTRLEIPPIVSRYELRFIRDMSWDLYERSEMLENAPSILMTHANPWLRSRGFFIPGSWCGA